MITKLEYIEDTWYVTEYILFKTTIYTRKTGLQFLSNVIAHTDENIQFILFNYENSNWLLRDHQKEFVESIKSFYTRHGVLSVKQFRWLTVYWFINK